jgi:hypothetical protein
MGCDVNCPSDVDLNPNDRIDDVKDIPNACTIPGQEKNKLRKYMPDNGEYEFVTGGCDGIFNYDCHYDGAENSCSMTCSSGCHKFGHCAVQGCKGRYKRIKYSADPSQCCLQRHSGGMIGNKTCDPDYRDIGSQNCNSTLLNYCKADKWDEPICKRWVGAKTANKEVIMNEDIANWCEQGENFLTGACQNWCTDVRTTQGYPKLGACDRVIRSYCDNHLDDEKCACYLGPTGELSKIRRMTNAPHVCWYEPCRRMITTNWLPFSTQIDRRNCKANVCYIEAGNINISGGGNVEFNNDCGDYFGKLTPGAEVVKRGVGGTVDLDTPEEAEKASQRKALLAIFTQDKNVQIGVTGAGATLSSSSCFSIICCILLVVGMFFMKKKQ